MTYKIGVLSHEEIIHSVLKEMYPSVAFRVEECGLNHRKHKIGYRWDANDTEEDQAGKALVRTIKKGVCEALLKRGMEVEWGGGAASWIYVGEKKEKYIWEKEYGVGRL